MGPTPKLYILYKILEYKRPVGQLCGILAIFSGFVGISILVLLFLKNWLVGT